MIFKHLGLYNPTINNYLVSQKYDFSELRSQKWLHND